MRSAALAATDGLPPASAHTQAGGGSSLAVSPEPTVTAPPKETPWLDGLNPAQLAAAKHGREPLLIVAGAGTGKTATLAARVANLLATGTPPDRILLLTFTRRAARELLLRAASLASVPTAKSWGGTFHAVANRLLRHHGSAVGLHPGFTVLDQGDASDLLGMLRTESGLGERGSRFPKKETLTSIYSRTVNAQRPLSEVVEEHFPWCRDHVDDMSVLFREATARKRRLHVLDFDDLLLYWRALLRVDGVGASIRAQFDHVLVDEYQDTNAIQADILEGLCVPGAQQGPSLTVVGDDAQAIYSFRAANVGNMAAVPQRWPETTVQLLEQNYRSTPEILAAANAVLAASSDHYPKQLWSTRPSGALPRLVTCVDEAEQSAMVCESVLAERERGIALRDQCVVFRSGHHSAGLEIELGRRRIPFVKYGGLKFLEAAHVKDLVALLRVLDNPSDELAWHRLLALLEGVGPATIRKVLATILASDDDAGDAPGGSGAATEPLVRFLRGDLGVPGVAKPGLDLLRDALASCAADTPDQEPPPAEQIERLLPFLEAVFPARYDDAPTRLVDLATLAGLAEPHRSRSGFLADLILDPPASTSDLAGDPLLDDDYLNLSTIHSAKGGEWHNVHVIHAADGNIPSDMSLGEPGGLEEERRLLYVALTRAKDTLTVSYPVRFYHRRFGNDDAHTYAQPSRFLDAAFDCFERSGRGVGVDGPSGGTEPVGPDPVMELLDDLFTT